MEYRYRIEIRRDSDAGVWVATSEDLPGLVVESATHEEAIDVVKDVLPDLLRNNGLWEGGEIEVPLEVLIMCEETVRLVA